MQKRNKYLLLGCGITTLLTGALSPLIYYEFKAQKQINLHNYDKAGKIYQELSSVSGYYLDRAAVCYYKDFTTKFKHGKHAFIHDALMSNPLLERDQNSMIPYFIATNKDSTAYKIMEIFLTIEQYINNNHRHAKSFSTSQNQKDMKHILRLLSQLDLEDKKYFEESLKALEITTYAEHTALAANDKRIDDALDYLTHLKEKYNILFQNPTIYSTQRSVQYSIIRAYRYYEKPLLPEEKQYMFEQKFLEQLRIVKKDNELGIKEHKALHNIKDMLPFKTTNEIKNIYFDFIKAYHEENKNILYLDKNLKDHFFHFCYALRKEYVQLDEKFSQLNDIYSLTHDYRLKSDIKAKKLLDLAQEYSNTNNRPLNEIVALFSISNYHQYAFGKVNKEDSPIGRQSFTMAFEIYKQYKAGSQKSFTDYYISICKRTNYLLLNNYSRNPESKYFKEIATSILKDLE